MLQYLAWPLQIFPCSVAPARLVGGNKIALNMETMMKLLNETMWKVKWKWIFFKVHKKKIGYLLKIIFINRSFGCCVVLFVLFG